MMTFFAPPFVMWFSAPRTVFPFLFTPSDLIVKRPVDSMTMSTPRSFQGRFAGSVSFSIFRCLPSTRRSSPETSTVPSKRP